MTNFKTSDFNGHALFDDAALESVAGGMIKIKTFPTFPPTTGPTIPTGPGLPPFGPCFPTGPVIRF